MTQKIRGVTFEENLNNDMGLEFYNLSHRFGYQSPNWPYFEDVKIERIHYMAKSGVLSQRITTSMHNTTHIDAPAHVVQGTPFIDEVPLPHFFGSGIVVSIPKKKWEPITYDDLEKAAGKAVRPRRRMPMTIKTACPPGGSSNKGWASLVGVHVLFGKPVSNPDQVRGSLFGTCAS